MSSPEAGLFLGVDGGGTKTAFALVDGDGNVRASALAPSCYYLGQSIDLVETVVADGIGTVCAEAGVGPASISHAFFAFPAYGEVNADIATLNAIPQRVLEHDRYACDNDMVAGWAGSLGGIDGVNVIAGTGSMTYGERRGRGLRVGGWGELFDDEGSAYWIAIRGLGAFAKMCDGRLAPGALQDRLRRHLDLPADLDLVNVVLNLWQGDRARIASLAPVVAAAAADGDEVCREILREAGCALAGLVLTTITELGYGEDERVPVSWSGGVFTNKEVAAAFRAQVGTHTVDLREPLLPPVLGSALYAARLAGAPLTEAAVARLQTSVNTLPQGDTDD